MLKWGFDMNGCQSAQSSVRNIARKNLENSSSGRSKLYHFIPFTRPAIGEEEKRAVREILESGWITYGRYYNQFEEKFRSYCGADGAVALSSATAGMHLVLKYYGI